MVGLNGPISKPGSSHTGVCRSVHFLGRLAIPISCSGRKAELPVFAQHSPDDARVLVGDRDNGPVHAAPLVYRVDPSAEGVGSAL